MATKKISDLTLRSNFDDTCSVPVDDATQTWRTTGAQIKAAIKTAIAPITTLGDLLFADTGGTPARLAGNTATAEKMLVQTGTGSASAAPAWREVKVPTLQKFTSGSGTYTKPAGVKYLRVRMVGGGGGGGGSGSSNGTIGGTGGSTTLGSSFLTAAGGVGANLTAGAGGGAAIDASALGVGLSGSAGSSGGVPVNTQVGFPVGGSGGASAFGGAGGGAQQGNAGVAAAASTGSGGGGAGGSSGAAIYGGGGGGAGGFIDVIIPSPASSYAYAVGAGGAAGGAGGAGYSGGAGAGGLIIVEEYYQ